MEGIPLLSGAYRTRSLIASAQRCVNLYPEQNPDRVKAPMPFTHYPRPGRTTVWQPPNRGAGRGLYTASNGELFAVVGNMVYHINAAFQHDVVGQIYPGTTPVSMADNGISGGGEIVLVDGSDVGYSINMATFAMSLISDPTGLFQGADFVRFLQTFFIFNVPGTQNFIISQPNSLTFDALDIAAKSSYSDNLGAIGIRMKELWLLGTKTSTEPWFLAGALDFPFESMPSTFVPYGIVAKYSLIFADTSLFWVSQNEQGQAIIVQTEGYTASRISDHAIEAAIQKYPTVADAVGQSYQIGGHTFVVFTFPAGDATWVYDLATKQWHELAWYDDEGVLHRDRALFYASAYGMNVAQDWETGAIYQIDPYRYTDDDRPIMCIRGFPTLVRALDRVTHWAVRAYMDCGEIEDPNAAAPIVNLRYSDDSGKTWGQPLMQALGKTGEYERVAQWNQLGLARSRVYELSWAAAAKTALNGVYVDPEDGES